MISIVTVNYNGKELMKQFMRSLKTVRLPKHEIIVVDNNSSDGSQAFIETSYKNVKLIKNKTNKGYVGINAAIPRCSGNYILFLNNDITLDKSCVHEMMNIIEHDNHIGMVAPQLVNYYDKTMKSGGTWVSRSFYSGHMSTDIRMKEIPYLGVGLVRTSVVKKTGYLFDPDYFIYGEDLELGLRLRLLGYTVVFAPSAKLNHMHAMTTKYFESAFTTFLLERNSLITFSKILSFRNILFLLPYVVGMRLVSIARDLLTFRFANAFARIRALLWVIVHVRLLVRKRNALQKIRKKDDSFILKVFSEKYLFRKRVIV